MCWANTKRKIFEILKAASFITMKNRVDVLSLEWTSYPSRDREAATLVCNYLKYMGVSVYEGSVFNGYFLIDRFNPKILFITNSVGSLLNLDIVKYAKAKGIVCISSMSEGNFNEDGISQFVWGVNDERSYFEDRVFYWSERAFRLASQKYPSINPKVGVCGAIGFDRYTIIGKELKEKPGPLAKYKYIVGVGCWNYDFLREDSHCFKKFNGKRLSDEDFNFFFEDREKFNAELLQFAKDNPSIGILIKQHPGAIGGDWSSGISGLRDLPNVYVFQNELSVMESISLSDLWLTYESTTALEAWLLGVPTCLLNPSGTDFNFREGYHLGQENFPNSTALSQAVECHKRTGRFPEAATYFNVRKDLIAKIIGFSDGLNHVRIGNAILEFLKNDCLASVKTHTTLWSSSTKLKRTLRWYLVRFAKLIGVMRGPYHIVKWDNTELKNFSQKRMGQMQQFYNKKSLTKKKLSEIKVSLPRIGS